MHWHIRQENIHAVMETEITCQKKDILWINYEAPNGIKHFHRLWNGGNGQGTVRLYRKTISGTELIDEVDAYNVGCEYGEYDE